MFDWLGGEEDTQRLKICSPRLPGFLLLAVANPVHLLASSCLSNSAKSPHGLRRGETFSPAPPWPLPSCPPPSLAIPFGSSININISSCPNKPHYLLLPTELCLPRAAKCSPVAWMDATDGALSEHRGRPRKGRARASCCLLIDV